MVRHTPLFSHTAGIVANIFGFVNRIFEISIQKGKCVKKRKMKLCNLRIEKQKEK